MEKKAAITFDNLPKRASNLNSNTLSKVFGGCKTLNESCLRDRNSCCPGYRCVVISNYKGPQVGTSATCMV
jgi:hypothetical protein